MEPAVQRLGGTWRLRDPCGSHQVTLNNNGHCFGFLYTHIPLRYPRFETIDAGGSRGIGTIAVAAGRQNVDYRLFCYLNFGGFLLIAADFAANMGLH